MPIRNHLFLFDVNNLKQQETFEYWYSKMSTDRKKKIDSYCFEKDKLLSLAAGILLYKSLEKIGIHKVNIDYTETGKAFLSDYTDIHFNLSHAGEIAVCAVSDEEVGVDIEEVRNFKKPVIKYICNDSELKYIESNYINIDLNPDETLTSLWTMKESLMKHVGKGLLISPKDISIDLENSKLTFCKGFDCSEAFFTRFDYKSYKICVCSRYEVFSSEIEEVRMEAEPSKSSQT